MAGGMVWSAALASRLPGSPVAVKESGVICEQPRSPKMPDRGENSQSSPLCEEMKSHIFELQLLMEYKLLGEQNMSGVYVFPSQQTLCEWHGVLFIHDGPWKGGVYRFSLIIPDEYPQMRPMFRFRTKITHPYVKHKNGQVNLYRVMPVWDPKKNHLHEVISAVRHSFLLPEVWQLDDKEEEKKSIDSFKRCAIRSAAAVSRDQDDTNGPENLLRLVDSGDQIISMAREMVHSGVLPTDPGGGPPSGTVLDQLSAHVSQFIGKVIGSN